MHHRDWDQWYSHHWDSCLMAFDQGWGFRLHAIIYLSTERIDDRKQCVYSLALSSCNIWIDLYIYERRPALFTNAFIAQGCFHFMILIIPKKPIAKLWWLIEIGLSHFDRPHFYLTHSIPLRFSTKTGFSLHSTFRYKAIWISLVSNPRIFKQSASFSLRNLRIVF